MPRRASKSQPPLWSSADRHSHYRAVPESMYGAATDAKDSRIAELEAELAKAKKALEQQEAGGAK